MFVARQVDAFPKALLALLLIARLAQPAQAQQSAATPVPLLSVVARDPLPGFRKQDEVQYLTDQMKAAGTPGWRFVAAPQPPFPPRERVEWHFELDPYAGGGIRQFFPMPGMQRLFGTRHLVTAEAMLYLDDEYQTLMFGQATIAGGAEDKALAAFIMRMTQGLLGEKGAYRSIDLGKPDSPGPKP
jgi:hypothetical protein